VRYRFGADGGLCRHLSPDNVEGPSRERKLVGFSPLLDGAKFP
jgi:hypothetical protein